MTWVILSLVSAVSLATSDAYMKKALGKIDEYLVAWLRLLFTVVALSPLLFFIEWPELDATFYRAFFTAAPFEVVAYLLYVKALRVSPMSLTLPFLALTPVFLILFSFFVLGETVSALGGAGIALVALGGYSLNLHHHQGAGLLGPIKAIFREKGSLMMIGTAAIYSYTASLGKLAIQHSSPIFFATTYFIFLTLVMSPLALFGFNRSRHLTQHWGLQHEGKKNNAGIGEMEGIGAGAITRAMLVPGFFFAVMLLTHAVAITLTEAAYMIAIKRTSLLFGVLYGRLLFGEGHLRERLLGASLMFAGLVLIIGASA